MKTYEKPTVQVFEVKKNNIIATSGGTGGSTGGGGWGAPFRGNNDFQSEEDGDWGQF